VALELVNLTSEGDEWWSPHTPNFFLQISTIRNPLSKTSRQPGDFTIDSATTWREFLSYQRTPYIVVS